MVSEYRETWNAKQWAFLESPSRFLDFEGALRSGKSWALVRKVLRLCVDYPGIGVLLCRYTQDALDAQLKPLFYERTPKELLGQWEAEEEYQTVGNGSRVYLRALKSSETSARYGKFQGLTLGAFGVDQAEEVPEDFWQVLKGRCSQTGTPMQRMVVANPPSPEHWLAQEFPEKGGTPSHELIQASIYDNAQHLDPLFIKDLEVEYPLGHPLRVRFVEGRRGISYLGKPIYGQVFNRRVHIQPSDINPELPLLEAWDFGRAAVLWAQFPGSRRMFYGEYLGHPGEFLETFVPEALQVRAHLFPAGLDILSCCDPAGADRTSHGTGYNAVEVLKEHGVKPRWVPGSNTAETRTYAIQQIAKALGRLTPQGPGLLVHPQCRMLVAAFEAGYVHDEQAPPSDRPSIIRPKKDGTYDHLMNCAEYLEVNFGTAKDATVPRRNQQPVKIKQPTWHIR